MAHKNKNDLFYQSKGETKNEKHNGTVNTIQNLQNFNTINLMIKILENLHFVDKILFNTIVTFCFCVYLSLIKQKKKTNLSCTLLMYSNF